MSGFQKGWEGLLTVNQTGSMAEDCALSVSIWGEEDE